MTDAELRDAAVAKLKQTTVGYVNRKWTTPPAGSFWKQGLDLLAQIATPVQPPAPMIFDGRATAVTSLPFAGILADGSEPKAVPATWATIYKNGDISLADDPRWGKVFNIRLNTASRNPWWTAQTADTPSCELTHQRPGHGIGTTEFYAMAFKITAWTPGRWGVVSQLNYPTLDSPPVAIDVSVNGIGVDRDAGMLTAVGARAPVIERPRFLTLSDVLGRWLRVIVEVGWEIEATGHCRAWTSVDEAPLVQRYESLNTPTYQQIIGQPLVTTPKDKQGAYSDAVGFPSGWENRLLSRGMTIHSTFPDAVEALA